MYFLAFQPNHAGREGSGSPIIVRDPIEEVNILSIIAQDRNSVVALFVDLFYEMPLGSGGMIIRWRSSDSSGSAFIA
jgi:hypothetical protein